MLANLLMGLLADLVFDCCARAGRVYQDEFHRYLTRRGFVTDSRPKRSTAN
jgi:hypothetical protein